MLIPTTFAALLIAGLSTAVPFTRRDNSTSLSSNSTSSISSNSSLSSNSSSLINDGVILNFALTLEFLETAFYREALQKFSHSDFLKAGFADPIFTDIEQVFVDEQTHVNFLIGALAASNITATVALEYSFPFNDVKTFITIASVLESVGVSAYLGAAGSISDKNTLTAAGAILGIESRHTAVTSAAQGQSPIVNAFETPLGFNEIFTIASVFIVGGSSPVTLPFTAFPPLTPEAPKGGHYKGNSTLTLSKAFANAQSTKSSIDSSTDIFAIFFSGLDKIAVQAHVSHNKKDLKVAVPSTVEGQVYVVLGLSETDFSDSNIVAGPAILEVF